MRFEFATATRILFGPGTVRDLPTAAAQMGRRALLVTGASAERAAPLVSGFDTVPFAVTGEPSIELIRRGTMYARAEGCDLVIAIGGGSAIDAGKALAALLTNPGDPLDYLEVIGRGQPLENTPAPFIAVPTVLQAEGCTPVVHIRPLHPPTACLYPTLNKTKTAETKSLQP